jgi:thymidine phosphorylase
VARIDAEAIGRAAMDLGAGRVRPGDDVDVEVGISLERKRGESVHAGDVLARVEARSAGAAERAAAAVAAAYALDDAPPSEVPLVLERRSS